MSLSAREAAFQALSGLERSGSDSGTLVDSISRLPEMDRRDKALAVRIVLGCLQKRILLNAILSRYSDTAVEKLDRNVWILLQTALYQIVFLDRVPNHAAVDETVRLAHHAAPRAVSFVNAVLRRAAAESLTPDSATELFGEDLAVRFSVEPWFAEYLIGSFGRTFAQEFLRACDAIPRICLQVNRLKISFEEYLGLLKEKEIAYEPAVPGKSVYVDSGDVRELPGYAEGLFYVQDPAAASCAEIAGIMPGNRVLDACSAPGGKSFSAALAMGGKGSILAADISKKKIDRIRENADRLGVIDLECRAADAKRYDPELDSVFDVVLADVPCSGFGVIGKKPEIRYKTRQEIEGLPSIQLSILKNVSRYVRPGGTLLYSTCTILREENEQVVERFLNAHPEYHPEDFRIDSFESRNGMFTFWPQLHGTDGFFAARLRRAEP